MKKTNRQDLHIQRRMGQLFFTLSRTALLRNAAAVTLTALWLQGTPATAGTDFTLDTAQKGAENGDAAALYFLAKAYSKGNGVPKDDEKAVECMRRAAEKGDAAAQQDLGAMYFNGSGVKQNDEEAVKWYRQAAEKGDALGEFNLGFCYASGRGVQKDNQQAISWYQKAAAQKQPDAIVALGYLNMDGPDGLKVDWKEAVKWYKMAGELGRADALNFLGYIYENGGAGVAPDLTNAANYFTEAAEMGDGKAQMNLGRLYCLGSGVEKDLVEAYKWFWLANQNGAHLAARYLVELQGADPSPQTLVTVTPLTAEQIAEARARANAWKERHKLAEKKK